MQFAPSISGNIPHDWHAKESMTFLAPDGTANVIASSEPLDPVLGAKEYAEIQGELLATEFPGYHERQFIAMNVFGGKSGFFRKFDWAPPDGDPVTQLQIYYAEKGRGYTATATTPSVQFLQVEGVLLEILEGLSF